MKTTVNNYETSSDDEPMTTGELWGMIFVVIAVASFCLWFFNDPIIMR